MSELCCAGISPYLVPQTFSKQRFYSNKTSCVLIWELLYSLYTVVSLPPVSVPSSVGWEPASAASAAPPEKLLFLSLQKVAELKCKSKKSFV